MQNKYSSDAATSQVYGGFSTVQITTHTSNYFGADFNHKLEIRAIAKNQCDY